MSTSESEHPKIILYWLEQSRSQRIVWLLEECGLPYEIKTYKRKNKFAPPELKEIHPLGKAPIVSIQAPGQAKPIILAESAFITEYLAGHFAKHLVPARFPGGQQDGKAGEETESWLRYRYYMHYAEGSLMAMLVTRYIFGALTGPEIPFFIKPITRAVVSKMDALLFDPNTKTSFEFLESQIASSPDAGEYLCGNKLTAADILMSFPLIAARDAAGLAVDRTKYPKLMEYIAKLEAMPSYQAAIKKAEEASGGEYRVM